MLQLEYTTFSVAPFPAFSVVVFIIAIFYCAVRGFKCFVVVVLEQIVKHFQPIIIINSSSSTGHSLSGLMKLTQRLSEHS